MGSTRSYANQFPLPCCGGSSEALQIIVYDTVLVLHIQPSAPKCQSTNDASAQKRSNMSPFDLRDPDSAVSALGPSLVRKVQMSFFF